MKTYNLQFNKWLFIFAILIVSLYCAVSVVSSFSEGRSQLATPEQIGRDNLRQLTLAVARYREEHQGALPFDERGGDYALYQLRPYLAVKFLACESVVDVNAPSWDDNAKKARNSGWHYLNSPESLTIPSNEIILVSRVREFPSIVQYAVKSGPTRAIRLSSSDAAKALIGSFVTDESFIAATKEVLDDWQRLRPTGLEWTAISSSGMKTVRSTNPLRNIVYEYEFTDDRPTARRIACNGREILERIVLDEFGRMSRIDRSPDEWQDIWSAGNAVAEQ